MSFFLFIYFSRLLDVTSRVTLPLHIPMFLMIGLLVLALSAGGVWRLAASRIGMFEMLFVVWVGVATAFSSWRSGSVLVFRNCLYSAMVFFAILTLVRSMAQLARVARAMAFAGLTAAVFSFMFAQDIRGGRVAVDIGTLADPNEYALVLLMTLPYWWLAARNSRSPKVMGAVAVLAAIPMLVAFFRTGSRAGLLTFGRTGGSDFSSISSRAEGSIGGHRHPGLRSCLSHVAEQSQGEVLYVVFERRHGSGLRRRHCFDGSAPLLFDAKPETDHGASAAGRGARSICRHQLGGLQGGRCACGGAAYT
jgi:hypothetical protein